MSSDLLSLLAEANSTLFYSGLVPSSITSLLEPMLNSLSPYDVTCTRWQCIQNGRHFQTTFSWMKFVVFWFRFHLFPRIQITIFQYCFRYWLGAELVTSHYLNRRWTSLLADVCVSRSQSEARQVPLMVRIDLSRQIRVIDLYRIVTKKEHKGKKWRTLCQAFFSWQIWYL